MKFREDKAWLSDSPEDVPRVVHAREVAALIESLGYTDRSAKALGFPDVFSLSEHLFGRMQQNPAQHERTVQQCEPSSIWWEIRRAARKFSLSFAYAVPWMVMLILEYLRPDALRVSAEVGGALSLSLIASLITSGGFVQTISRSGNFYHGLKEPALAHRTCLSLLNIGLTSSLAVALLGMLAGSYFHLFAGSYLVLAALNYVALSLLWMLCAMLSVQGIGWCIPLVFSVSLLLGGLIKILANPETSILLELCPLLAALFAFGCALAGSHRAESKLPQSKESARPRGGVLFITLAPFYIYGTLYFSFLFADRLTAGTAVPWISGLSFGIDAGYKKGTDLALLAFLIAAALVEYLADSFLRFWQKRAADLPQTANQQLVMSLRKHHGRSIFVISLAFLVIASSAWFVFSGVSDGVPAPRVLQTAAIAGLGYLLLSMALLEIIILASINAISTASLAVAVGLAVNLITGYGLSHLWGVQYAAVGLLAGSAVVLWISNAAVRRVLQQPDYHYSVS